MSAAAKAILSRIHALALPDKVKILNVCGGHERAISSAGIRTALPAAIELIPGPGCPVCICPEEDIYEAMQLALRERVILLAFGDMLRVPVNLPRNQPRTLDQARAAGADIRPVASPAEVVRVADSNPGRPVVFFAAGFETTMAPVAGMLAEGVPDNLAVLLSGRLTWPAVALLLDSGEASFDALIAPGHVATVMGAQEWQFVADRYGIPAAIAGFSPDTLLAATHAVLCQLLEGRPRLENCYPQVVRAEGNMRARRLLSEVMNVTDANWRGIGVIPRSGFELSAGYASHDARRVLPSYRNEVRKRMGEMPPGCDCARVVLGKLYPNQCRLYGNACTPRAPIGPCMVSDEGACRIWWANGVRPNERATANAAAHR